jgi:uncharacterized protein
MRKGNFAMSDHQNVKFVQNIYGLFKKGDIAGLLDHFAEDVEWETPGAPRVPYAGHFRSRAAVAKFFEDLGKTAEFAAFEPRDFLAKGDRVVVLGHYAGTGRSTGRRFETDWVMVFTIGGGKVTKFKEYFDTANLGEAFT